VYNADKPAMFVSMFYFESHHSEEFPNLNYDTSLHIFKTRDVFVSVCFT